MYTEKEKLLIYLYDDYLLNDNPIPPYYLSPAQVNESVLIIMRYAFEKLVRWTPREVMENMDAEIIEKLKLKDLINRLEIPQYYEHDDYYYYAHMMYPEEKFLDEESMIRKHYEDILSGKIQRFPRGFIEGDEGEKRISICFRYILEKEGFKSIDDIYYYFSTAEGNKLLKRYNLDIAKRNHYEKTIDFVHATLSESQRNYDLYHYLRFKSCKLSL